MAPSLLQSARGVAQTLAVGASVRPTLKYLLASLGPDTPRTFYSKQLEQRIRMRPVADRQVARELLSKGIWELPPEVHRAVAARGSAPRVLDLGGNIGMFTLTAVHAFGPGATVTVVEPAPANLELLHANLALNGLADRVTVLAGAAGPTEGTATLILHDPHNNHLARGAETDTHSLTVPVLDAIALASESDFVKIDIEGSEWDLLADPRLGEVNAAAIGVEWHAYGDAAPSEPLSWLSERFRSSGFSVGYEETVTPELGWIWAWREPS